jgi:hypothetical protein
MGGAVRGSSVSAAAHRAQVAFELSLQGKSTRAISDIMKRRGFHHVSHTVVAELIRKHADAVVLPLAREHVVREYDRLMAQRERLDALRDHAMTVLKRFHVHVNQSGVVMMIDPVTKDPTPIRDDGPELAAINTCLAIEDRVLKNAEAMAKLFGYNAPERVNVTMTDEVDSAIKTLVDEMNSREDATPISAS